MCHTACKGCCGPAQAMYWLVLVGALNWGLVGLGSLVGQGNWNLVSLLFSNLWLVEPIVYLLVGASAVGMLVGCRCKKCKGGPIEKGGCCGGGGCGPKMSSKEDVSSEM